MCFLFTIQKSILKMGVITKKETNLQLNTSISEETLYIPSSEDDRSEISVEIRHTQSRILSNRRVPTVASTVGSPKRHCGKKKSRRYQNVNSLVTLAEEDELHEVTIEDFVEVPKTIFSRLLEDELSFQKWTEFVDSTEERQQQVLKSKRRLSAAAIKNQSHRLSSTLRSLLKKRNLPFGMVQYLENELINFFCEMPKNIYTSPELSSFERLLLHSLSDYHSLKSQSFDSEPKRIRLVQVKNPNDEFKSPSLLLTDYLEKIHIC